MDCTQTITHVVAPGESLYEIAEAYQTSVNELLEWNPGINPYNLLVGTPLKICTETYNLKTCSSEIGLNNRMRLVWEQHIYWSRMLLVSIISRLSDEQAVTNRLLQNPEDIAMVFGAYFSEESTNMLARLLTEHLQLGAELITALRDGDRTKADLINRQWYANADQLALTFAQMSPYYRFEEVKDMLYQHLGMLKNQTAYYLAGRYQESIQEFDASEQQILALADYLANGIVLQFPEDFR